MSLVTIDRRNGLAYVTIDNPPVNSLGRSVRKNLLLACTSLAADKEVAAVVVSGKGRNFVAGADIGELGQTPSEPFLPDVLSAIENAPMPWVAAISGVALGGGLELAMACHGRVADRGARLGLPEVNLGVIPGAGGTVRLPRLVPMADAVSMITGGKPIAATHALDIGLLDRIAQADLIRCATALAQELAQKGPPVPTITRPCHSSDKIDWEAVEKQMKQKSRGAVAPLEALSSLHTAAQAPASEALSAERARFLRLTTSEQAAALRYVFFAERAAGKSLRSHDTPPVDLRQVGVIGGGTMGAGIATALVLAGSQVRLVERDAPVAEAGRARVAQTIADSVKRGVLAQGAAKAAIARLSTGSDYAALADCALVIEAVFEDMAVKRQVFSRLDAVMPAEAVLATNTSYLDVDALAETTRDPARILGLHFFSPAHVMKLLEVVRGRETGARALATGAALARLLGKVPVVAGVCDGFIGNRIMAAYRRDCEFMLEEGALPQQIDAAMQDYGFAMGIFAVQDLSGLDIAWAQRKAQAPSRDPSARYARIADQLCEAGRLGRKTGQGWYDYASGAAKSDPAVEAIIQAEQARAGRKLRSFSAEDIMARILGRMQAEGAALLQEGISESAADIDVVMVTGYGFPRHKGGPMYLAAKSSSEGKDA
ncbi:3-hydroxyacyl-CoA dehydrogenase [Frigidibacter albus]|uniref:3-hydroxyacyl-CoA dehydrogenase n=1 Tax=Frigidibacter albus TaxID=1465486 RepID=A0A6L8VNK7_9RHOB|nr:3-hydroxyacyl-CoA dehydrogenase NAD-binding domain-containing protein [Frigidibacter albus]MZQ91052.1 3-hydroxyacyl-CoA dehydrogenase [Frigidibacter albus]NBE32937.1 3-hydroxyacyl-CoA dehydrogenase [Frigidibacter albus]GGH62526.1 3-hydroxyacyl-CoA dehydrogenase [Frigidibacter albus]